MRLGRMAAVALLFASCQTNSLDGSISEAFDLSFTSVQIRRGPTAMEVSYLRSEGNEVTIRLTVDFEGLDVSHGGSIDLSQEYAPGHPRAAVSRAVDNEPVRQLPDVVRGTLDLDGDPTPGANCSGSFSMAFGEGGDLGAGRTLTGSFSAMVEGTDP